MLTRIQTGVSDIQAQAFAIGVDCKNNAVTPLTQFDMNAAVVTLVKSNGGTISRFAPGVITNNILTAGPIANGRDQAGAFSANSFIHFYWIWNPTTSTLATLSSASATSPTLPAGYTHKAYAGSVRFGSLSDLYSVRIKGNKVFYTDSQSALSNGNQIVETAIDLSALVPANALQVSSFVLALVDTDGSGKASANLGLSLTSGNPYGNGFYAACATTSFTDGDQSELDFPNVAQNIFYQWTVSVGTPADQRLSLYILGYTVPNGG